MFWPKKPVAQLNLAGAINLSTNLFTLPIICFSSETGLKLNLPDEINYRWYLFLRLSLGCYAQKADLKLNIYKNVNSPINLFNRLSLCFCAKPVLNLNISKRINPPTGDREIKRKSRHFLFVIYPLVCVKRGSPPLN